MAGAQRPCAEVGQVETPGDVITKVSARYGGTCPDTSSSGTDRHHLTLCGARAMRLTLCSGAMRVAGRPVLCDASYCCSLHAGWFAQHTSVLGLWFQGCRVYVCTSSSQTPEQLACGVAGRHSNPTLTHTAPGLVNQAPVSLATVVLFCQPPSRAVACRTPTAAGDLTHGDSTTCNLL